MKRRLAGVSSFMKGALSLSILLLLIVGVLSVEPSLRWTSKSRDWVRVQLMDASTGEAWHLQDSYDLESWRSLAPFEDSDQVLERDRRHSAQRYFRAIKGAMPDPETLLAEARERWETLGWKAYQFDYRETGEFGCRHWRASVKGGDVQSFEGICWEEWAGPVTEPPTIDAIFERIATALASQPHRVVIHYHPTLGYPESGFIDFDERIADEEWSFEIPANHPGAREK